MLKGVKTPKILNISSLTQGGIEHHCEEKIELLRYTNLNPMGFSVSLTTIRNYPKSKKKKKNTTREIKAAEALKQLHDR